MSATLAAYPYADNESTLIHLDEQFDFMYWGNDIHLQYMLQNILNNAFTSLRQKGHGQISLWAESIDNQHVLHIKDTGLGATPDIVERLFEPYFSTKSQGVGLGLALCQELMQSFGGYITAEAKLGQYMHFRLFFPEKNYH